MEALQTLCEVSDVDIEPRGRVYHLRGFSVDARLHLSISHSIRSESHFLLQTVRQGFDLDVRGRNTRLAQPRQHYMLNISGI